MGLLQILWPTVLTITGITISRLVYNVFFHPLRDVIRVGPDELHFSNPAAYHEIYSSSTRWDKESTLYESFGEDHSSFGLQQYHVAKQQKDVLQPMFSRKAILGMQDLIRQNMDHLADVLAKNSTHGKSSDLLFAFRSFAIDNITSFCFATSVNAMDAPDFKAPIVEAMDNSLPTFHVFKHFPLIRKTIFALPPWLAIKASPETAGLTQLQVILKKQVNDVVSSPTILESAPHATIYQRLLDPEAHKGGAMPDKITLYEEAMTMLFAGGVTVGDTMMTGTFHILNNEDLYKKLKAEVRNIWPDLNSAPTYEILESLPLLTATIKESLRVAPGACSPLLRIVPATGSTISSHAIPGGTIVGMSSFFVHQSSYFPNPSSFAPERWMGLDSKGLEQWLVSFSRGPRSCLGINLAYCELYIGFATMLRRLDMKPDGMLEGLVWRDCFTPFYPGAHLKAWCESVGK